jgi:hypothetical protein
MVVRITKGSSKKTIQKLLSKIKSRGFPASRFTGKIEIKEDALAIQKKLRNEYTV